MPKEINKPQIKTSKNEEQKKSAYDGCSTLFSKCVGQLPTGWTTEMDNAPYMNYLQEIEYEKGYNKCQKQFNKCVR